MLKRVLNSAWMQRLIARVAVLYLTCVARTTCWEIEGETGMSTFSHGPPMIIAFWHETLPAMPILWLRAKPHLAATVLASRHRDGQLIGMVVNHFNIAVAAGSTSRGGAAGLRALVTALREGRHVGLTPDGPRGPRRVAAAGIAQLAALTGAPVMTCAAATRWAIQLQSWDGMRFPLPFGRGRLVCSPCISIGRADWQSGLSLIEAGLNDAVSRASGIHR